MPAELWIIVPNWDKFQHYKDRSPPWIKQYTDLVHRDEYLELPPTSRALLHGIWALYALSGGRLRHSETASQCRLRVEQSHWDALIEAGFIQLSASKPLAPPALAREEKRREERAGAQAHKPPNPATSHRHGDAERTAAVVRGWIQGPAFVPEADDDEAVLEEIGRYERRFDATLSGTLRSELLELARGRRRQENGR